MGADPMSYAGLLLIVMTRLHRYVVRREHMLELRVVADETDLERPDEHDKPLERCELGPLLDPHDTPTSTRRHALIVPSHLGSVAFLVDRIEDMQRETSTTTMHPMPSLFVRQLKRPWFPGVFVLEETPLLVLDLRQIAQDVLIQRNEEHEEHKKREQESTLLWNNL